jgi:Ulp1 family protease
MEVCQQEVIVNEDADKTVDGIFCTEDLTDGDLLCLRPDKWLNDKVTKLTN